MEEVCFSTLYIAMFSLKKTLVRTLKPMHPIQMTASFHAVQHIIGGRDSYKDFINRLRDLFAHRKDGIRSISRRKTRATQFLGNSKVAHSQSGGFTSS